MSEFKRADSFPQGALVEDEAGDFGIIAIEDVTGRPHFVRLNTDKEAIISYHHPVRLLPKGQKLEIEQTYEPPQADEQVTVKKAHLDALAAQLEELRKSV